MAKCPLARVLILSSGGATSYTTPLTVEKLKEKHDNFLKIVDINLRGAIEKLKVSRLKLEPEDYCLTLDFKDRCYTVCGRPDIAYVLYTKDMSPIFLVGEVTLSPSIEHIIKGELTFYILEHYMQFGMQTAGFVVSTKSIRLIIPKFKFLALIKRLFKMPSYDDAIANAEKMRAKSLWICSLCDLKHVCPLGGEL